MPEKIFSRNVLENGAEELQTNVKKFVKKNGFTRPKAATPGNQPTTWLGFEGLGGRVEGLGERCSVAAPKNQVD